MTFLRKYIKDFPEQLLFFEKILRAFGDSLGSSLMDSLESSITLRRNS